MSHVLLAHAPGEEGRAALVAEKLDALGYKVRRDDIVRPLSPLERRKLAAEIDAAACVLLLWSREAADEPALRAAAERAQARGKLALARLDSAAPPVGFKAAANLANWLGNEQTRAWREVLSAVGAAAKPPAKGAAKSAPSKPAPSVAPAAEAKKGGAGLGISLLVLLAAGGAAAAHFVLHLF